ncbi:ankyrin repeat domain-containing protein [Winogradskyella sp. UBA3174]|uniref:ankyrin repeat domain-containing protein n=1 Tax=Winogradskyella sp. UBA3174 TaxID=1947785 RepID=UPI0025E3F3F7|nr:ankyrin repeat domain-containing protein [Winogradskyella sp. UBA3174]|tara:strand:+ start:20694 stop:21089 length:396 start_codon:yes stop_codon:yes gene_type:complete
MKKTVVVFALALGFSISSLNAFNSTLSLNSEVNVEKRVEVSPLCKAVATGDIVTVKKLIKKGADVNAKSNGLRPIHYAAKYNRVELIKVLLTAGSEVHATCDEGYTALAYAKKANAKDAELFLKRFKKKNI